MRARVGWLNVKGNLRIGSRVLVVEVVLITLALQVDMLRETRS